MIKIISLIAIVLLLGGFIFNLKNTENFSNNSLKNKRAVICGCAKDIQKYIENSTNKMAKISEFFADYKIIIFENDSKDNTLKLLKNFEKTHKNVIILSETGLHNKTGYTRTCKLAYARNKIIEYVENNNLGNFDYLINMDMDNVNEKLNIKLIKDILEDTSFNNWSVITANQKVYYDFWALRTKKNNENCWSKTGLCRQEKKKLKNWIDESEHSKFSNNSINENSKPIKVLSAFGGLGIYKMKYLLGCRYNSIDQKNNLEHDCEHVAFNKCIRNNGGDIYIHPKLINS